MFKTLDYATRIGSTTAFFIFRCVSIYNFMEKMEIIRLYDCWTNGMDNLRFDKEGYLLVLFSAGYFIKDLENILI